MTIHLFGGGTISHVRSHLALCAPARGTAAKTLGLLLSNKGASIGMHPTFMASEGSRLVTNEDVRARLALVLADPATRAVVFSAALCDFNGQIGDVPSGAHAERLKTRDVPNEGLAISLTPADKVIGSIKKQRPDVLVVGFKTTAGESAYTQVEYANRMASECRADLILANDTVSRTNIVLLGTGTATLPDARYEGHDRNKALRVLADSLLELHG
jgi:hypothetical protein